MSTKDFQGAAHAFKTFMRLAAEDIAKRDGEVRPGDIRPAKVKYARAHPAKVLIGRFKARLLYMAARKARA